ncbi:uncharacterized protein LOC123266742 [Cotesia glomerata]|nr:uncharacterized protein LOC123266742 [Cotesia glomerata]
MFSLDCLKCTPADKNYFDPSEELAEFELNISSKTEYKKFAAAPVTQTLLTVSLSEIPNLYGFIVTEGFIHDNITTSGKYGNGSGSITDLQFKVTIQVYNMKNQSNVINAGSHVRVNGKLCRDKNFGIPYIQCQDLSNITLIDDKVLTEIQLNRNYRSPQPKRIRSPSTAHQEKKFSADCKNRDVPLSS